MEIIKQYERYITRVATTLTHDDEIKKDLEQEGRLAVWYASQNHKPELGEFHSYCISIIRGKMLNWLTDNARTVRLPAHQVNQSHTSHNPNSITESKSISINTPINDFQTLGDTIADESIEYTETTLQSITEALNTLKPKWQTIIKMRGEGKQMSEIGEALGLSKQAVSEQYRKAIIKIQKFYGVEITNQKSNKYYNKKTH